MKSFAGEDVDSAAVNPWGLEQDRRWALVDSAGTSLTARQHNQLLGLSANALSDTAVQLADRDGSSVTVDMLDGGDTIQVSHSGQGTAVAARGEVNRWLSERVGFDVRLVWQPDPTVRAIDPEDGGQPGEVVSLADGGPLLLATEPSLRQLDEWTDPEAVPLDMVRFRPNVIIDDLEPFIEESWTSVTIGDVRFRVTMICDRCVMTTIEPTTLVRGKEPIRTLAVHRQRDHKTWFGIRLTPLDPGRIHVGDRVEAEVSAASTVVG
ncbi:MOSC domain-containing protein [Salinibacterium sp. M195]|uniref:MOSC domain-containing protein n=1 Tax=Salinibacterium sp. M195 TaxID=2583374 RepID=UPI002105FFC6|nr:MOSC domain-containing protein [Salinibacterium sp. M195]